MRVDSFDNTLVCEDGDLQESLGYFKEYRQLPLYVERAIVKLILRELACEYSEEDSMGDLLDRLPEAFVRNSIASIEEGFDNSKKIDYRNFHLAYLLYYLPANVFKIWKPLLELHIRSTLKQHMRILDVGTGPGSIPLGIIEFYKSLATSYPHIELSLSFVLLEKEKEFIHLAREIIETISQDLPENLLVDIEDIYRDRISKDYETDKIGKFDLISMSNFLAANEEDNQKYAEDIIKNFKSNLEEDASLIIIEPGDRPNGRSLKLTRNRLVNRGDFTLYSPCIGILEEKENYSCSCFNTVRVHWELPEIYRYLLGKGLSKGRRDYVPFNYLVLRTDGLRKYQVERNDQHFVKLDELWENIGQVVNVLALVRTFIKKGDSIHFALCDGSCSFNNSGRAVWVNMSMDDLQARGIRLPIISAEKIRLGRVLVRENGEGVELELAQDSTIVVDY